MLYLNPWSFPQVIAISEEMHAGPEISDPIINVPTGLFFEGLWLANSEFWAEHSGQTVFNLRDEIPDALPFTKEAVMMLVRNIEPVSVTSRAVRSELCISVMDDVVEEAK